MKSRTKEACSNYEISLENKRTHGYLFGETYLRAEAED